MRVRLTAVLDPKAKMERPDLKTGTTHAKALGHGSGAALQDCVLVEITAQPMEATKS